MNCIMSLCCLSVRLSIKFSCPLHNSFIDWRMFFLNFAHRSILFNEGQGHTSMSKFKVKVQMAIFCVHSITLKPSKFSSWNTVQIIGMIRRCAEKKNPNLTYSSDLIMPLWLLQAIFRVHSITFKLFVCFFVLRFYGPVNPMGSCRARSVYLTTRLLGRLGPLNG